MAEYPNGQQVFFNVRNVNYNGYKRQVENQYYFEDGGRIIGNQYFAKGSDKGEKIDFGQGKVTPEVIGEALLQPVAGIQAWQTVMLMMPTMGVFWAT